MRNMIVSTAAILSLSACGGNVEDSLGLSKKAPDEYSVVSHPPLEVPPEFGLRPPSDAGNSVADTADTASAQGKSLLLPATAGTTTSTPMTGADAALLGKTGAATADSGIRQTLDQEYQLHTTTEAKRNWFSLGSKKDKETLNAAEERTRLQDAKAKQNGIQEGSASEPVPATPAQ
jgi:hypothetical protein